jgi:hypothetical protein
MAIEVGSPLWSVLADWIKILLTLPDPPPEQLGFVSDVIALTAINGLADHLSPQFRKEVREALLPVTRKAMAVAK